MDKRTVASAHERIDEMQIKIAEIRTEVKIQFKEVFARVKRLEATLFHSFHFPIESDHINEQANENDHDHSYYDADFPIGAKLVGHFNCWLCLKRSGKKCENERKPPLLKVGRDPEDIGA